MIMSTTEQSDSSSEKFSSVDASSICETKPVVKPVLNKSYRKIFTNFTLKNDIEGLKTYLKNVSQLGKRDLCKILIWSTYEASYSIIQTLIMHGNIDINRPDSDGNTALHHVVYNMKPELVLLLLRNGANQESWTVNDETLLHWACRHDFVDVAQCLLKLGARLTIPDGCGRFPLHIACLHGSKTVVPKVLMSIPKTHGIIFKTNDQAPPPRHRSISLRMRISTGFNIEAEHVGVDTHDNNGWTPLHYACTSLSSNAGTVVRILLDAHANPLTKTPHDKTAFDLAFESGRDILFLENLQLHNVLQLLMVSDSISQNQLQTFNVDQDDSDDSGQEYDETFPRNSTETCLSRMSRNYSFLQENFQDMWKNNERRTLPRKTKEVTIDTQAGSSAPHIQSTGNLNEWSLKVIWQHIIRNDDMELLDILKVLRVTQGEPYGSSELKLYFEDAYFLDPKDLADIHTGCVENGLEIFTYVWNQFSIEIERNDYLDIFTRLTRFERQNIIPDVVENCTIMWPMSSSVLFISLLCGRLSVVEALLRARQFDILPSIFIVILILRKFESEIAFSGQAKKIFKEFSDKLEKLAVDILNRIFLKDNTESRFATISYLTTKLGCLGKTSILDVAARSSCETFLGLPCCQIVLNKLWLGKLNWLPHRWQIVKVVLPFFLPIFFWIRNRPNQIKFLKSHTTGSAGIQNLFLTSNAATNRSVHLPGRPCTFLRPRDRGSMEVLKNTNFLDDIAMIRYAFRSPLNRFIYHSVAHLMFLILFSYVLIYDFHLTISTAEYICYWYILGYSIEEFIELVRTVMNKKIRFYLFDFWNFFDICSIILTILGIVMRTRVQVSKHYNAEGKYHNIPDFENSTFFAARLVLLSGLLSFYLRFLFVFTIFSSLGPKLRMMFEMIKNDLFPMLAIFSLFFVSFGVIFHALLYPNGYDIANYNGLNQKSYSFMEQLYVSTIVQNIASMTFYGMAAAEYNLEKLQPNPVGSCNETECVKHIKFCKTIFTHIYYVIFVLIVNIMLVNLLIALFSDTVSRINEKSRAHWLADKYTLIHEFLIRTVIPPPFNTIYLLIDMVVRCFRFVSQIEDNDGETEKCSCRLVRFIIVQSFGLKGYRDILGQVKASETNELKKRLEVIEKEIVDVRKYFVERERKRKSKRQYSRKTKPFVIRKSWYQQAME